MACHIANCCCCSVRTGSLVLGVLLIIGSIAGIIICGIAGIISGFTFFLLGVIGCSVTLVISILLVVGVHKDNSKLVRPCVYYYAAHIIFTVIIMIVAIVKIMAVAAAVAAAVDGGGQISEQERSIEILLGPGFSMLGITFVVIVGAINILIVFFCWLCVYSYLQDLESRP